MIAVFSADREYRINSKVGMEVNSHFDSDKKELRVLVWPGVDDLSRSIPAGVNELFTIDGDVTLERVEAADYIGNSLELKSATTVLPAEFALHQNRPNPFNPTTKIGLDLPVASEWTIEIFNVAGQRVKSFNGHGVGNVIVAWNASEVSSGIYFYKAAAGQFSDTKKMVLLK